MPYWGKIFPSSRRWKNLFRYAILGQNFSKGFCKTSKENSSTLEWLSQSDAKKIEEEIRDSASACIVPHWGKIFLSSRS
jgi:hypothetical protein